MTKVTFDAPEARRNLLAIFDGHPGGLSDRGGPLLPDFGSSMAGITLTEAANTQYRLGPQDVVELTSQLLNRFDPLIERAVAAGHSSLCVAIDGIDPLSNLGRDIEQRAFETLANNLPPEVMSEEYGPYEDRSLFLIGIDLEKREARATLRLISGNSGIGPPTKSVRDAVLHVGYAQQEIDLTDEAASKRRERVATGGTFTHCEGPHLRISRNQLEQFHHIPLGALIFDVASLARQPGIPAKEAGVVWTPLLIAGFLRLATTFEVEHAVTFITVDLLKALQRLCAGTWVNLGDTNAVHYVPGDAFPSQPSYLDIEGFRRNLRSRRASIPRRPIPETALESYAHDKSKDSAFGF